MKVFCKGEARGTWVLDIDADGGISWSPKNGKLKESLAFLSVQERATRFKTLSDDAPRKDYRLLVGLSF